MPSNRFVIWAPGFRLLTVMYNVQLHGDAMLDVREKGHEFSFILKSKSNS